MNDVAMSQTVPSTPVPVGAQSMRYLLFPTFDLDGRGRFVRQSPEFPRKVAWRITLVALMLLLISIAVAVFADQQIWTRFVACAYLLAMIVAMYCLIVGLLVFIDSVYSAVKELKSLRQDTVSTMKTSPIMQLSSKVVGGVNSVRDSIKGAVKRIGRRSEKKAQRAAQSDTTALQDVTDELTVKARATGLALIDEGHNTTRKLGEEFRQASSKALKQVEALPSMLQKKGSEFLADQIKQLTQDNPSKALAM